MTDDTHDEVEPSPEELQEQLRDLRQRHRHMDEEIAALLTTGAVDMINVQRMKKLKLKLKDKIAVLEDMLTPDIIA